MIGQSSSVHDFRDATRERRSAMAVGTDGTVLVVEDDESMREAIARLLRAGGYTCTAYVSADAMLARDFDRGSACVISDLKMPGMSGLELLATLRERHISVPFILITAHDEPGMRENALRCGAAGYVAKPFRGTALLEVVKNVLRSSNVDGPPR
jgi:FixJ family two-component response regulator